MSEQHHKVLEAAARQLSIRALSVSMLRKKLLEKEYEAEGVEYAIEWLSARGMLNDTAYAESVVRGGIHKGWGASRIRQTLLQRGLDKELVEQVLQAQYITDEDRILALLEKKLRGAVERKEVDKAVAMLQRRGYAWSEIRQALEAYRDKMQE